MQSLALEHQMRQANSTEPGGINRRDGNSKCHLPQGGTVVGGWGSCGKTLALETAACTQQWIDGSQMLMVIRRIKNKSSLIRYLRKKKKKRHKPDSSATGSCLVLAIIPRITNPHWSTGKQADEVLCCAPWTGLAVSIFWSYGLTSFGKEGIFNISNTDPPLRY